MRERSSHLRKRKKECTLEELVSESGVLQKSEIFFIIRQLCLLPTCQEGLVHPQSIRIEGDGSVRMLQEALTLSGREAYFPPEWDQAVAQPSGGKVYALGMLMLYMSTGDVKKAEAETTLDDRILSSLIRRCTAFDPKERFPDEKALLEAIQRETGIRKRAGFVLLAAFLFLILSLLLLFSRNKGKTHGEAVGEAVGYEVGFLEGFEQGFSDAPGIGLREAAVDIRSGNLSGNYASQKGAFSVSGDNQIFFVPDGGIRQMDPYTGETKTLLPDIGAYDLQFYDGRLYFCTAEEKLVSLDPKTAKEKVLCRSYGGRFYIFEDIFYLYDSAGTGYLYRIDPDTGDLTQLNGAMSYRCLNVTEGKLYYIDPGSGGCIYRSDLDGGRRELISSSVYESLCIQDGRIYAGSEDGLIRMELNGAAPENLTTLPADLPVATDNGIFFISGNDRTLEWMSLDGKTRYTVVTTSTASFNVAGQWIFYRNEEDDGRLWRVRISGADNARLAR